MNSNDESLRRWCIESLAAMRKIQYGFSADIGCCDSNAAAEWVVEMAAFQRMLNLRGLVSNERLFSYFQRRFDAGSENVADNLRIQTEACHSIFTELVNEATASCPLDRDNPPEVLGTVHEFLMIQRSDWNTKTIRRSTRSRKSNGVFYTPQYVIDDIIRHTLGPRVKDATPEEVDQITILDPAAGCGAFLVAAFRYLVDWHLECITTADRTGQTRDAVLTDDGWKISFDRAKRILINNLFGVDLDESAVESTRRILWLTLHDVSGSSSASANCGFDQVDLTLNFQHGHTLIGASITPDATEDRELNLSPSIATRFDWNRKFPSVSRVGGFDLIIGNPPYRRERDFKPQLDEIAATPFGKRYQSPRMDVCYYFIHRGIELLKTGGTLSFITSAYWIQGRGADKLISVLRDQTHLDELFLLGNRPVFAGISGQHAIFRLTKSNDESGTIIRMIPRKLTLSTSQFFTPGASTRVFVKSKQQLFCDGRLDVSPVADKLFDRFRSCPGLIEFGSVRQGIAENPASINRRTLERFRDDPLSKNWAVGEGVFSLSDAEVTQLSLEKTELELLQPYHALSDLGRYWSAPQPLRRLIYSTRHTCPDIDKFPKLRNHLARFRPIMESRRETAGGHISWWHLHWPRNEVLWRSGKLIVLQMAARPSFVPTLVPSYVPFSANVFVPIKETREDLNYFCGLLNSRLLWAWFAQHAKRRGVGLELNGHVLERAPIRRIDFQCARDIQLHDDLVALVHQRLNLQRAAVKEDDSRTIDHEIAEIEAQIEDSVARLYELDAQDIELVNEITES